MRYTYLLGVIALSSLQLATARAVGGAEASVTPTTSATIPPPQATSGKKAPFQSKDARYTCQKNEDCAVVEHGNCCGSYPVCARPDAVFTEAEKCAKQNGGPGGGARPGSGSGSDGFGVCGHPVLDACRCQEGVCVGLKGDKVVGSPME